MHLQQAYIKKAYLIAEQIIRPLKLGDTNLVMHTINISLIFECEMPTVHFLQLVLYTCKYRLEK